VRYVITIDQSISGTGWNLFIDGKLNSFGRFGSTTGTKKDDKPFILFHSDNHWEDWNGKINSHSSNHRILREETDNFQRVKWSVKCFQEVLSKEIGSNPCKFVFENLAFGAKGNATRDVAGLLFSMISSSLKHGQYILVAPTSAKKVFTGDGKATKLQMIKKLPKNIRECYLEAGYKYSEKTGAGSLNDLADSYSFYQWYLQQ